MHRALLMHNAQRIATEVSCAFAEPLVRVHACSVAYGAVLVVVIIITMVIIGLLLPTARRRRPLCGTAKPVPSLSF